MRHLIDSFVCVIFPPDSCPDISRYSAAVAAAAAANWSSSFTASPRRPSQAAGTATSRGRKSPKGVGRKSQCSSTRQRQISHRARERAEGSGKLPRAIRGRTERKFQATPVVSSCQTTRFKQCRWAGPE